MNVRACSVNYALVSLLLVAPSVAAQSRNGSSRPVSLTETATRLAESGAATKDARTLMAAAQILRMVERGSTRVHRVGDAVGPTGAWEGPMTSASLLRLASTIATDAGDWGMAEYAAWLMQLPDSVPTQRGATGGPVWADAYLPAGREISYEIAFSGGRTPNQLSVSAGKSDATLECVLREGGDTGRVTVRARSVAGTCSMEWRQATSGRMTLRIRNNGRAAYFVVSSN